MGRVEGKVAIVTGGARGIGRAIVEVLAREGAKVVSTDINAEQGEQAARETGAARFMVHDVVEEDQWRKVIAATVEAFGRLDILVNNAGVLAGPGPTDVEHVSPEGWGRVLDVNGLGVMLGCKHAVEPMRKAGGGSIINMSSVAALMPGPTMVAYGFSKAGVAHLSKSMARLGAPSRIRCNSVHPGAVRTMMLDEVESNQASMSNLTAERVRDNLFRSVPMGAYQDDEDIAKGVLFLASDDSRWITGQELVIDGGMTL
jgi:NAD(P)-dependent dehydrogenase (short-subunit alcohol dehydrogenase family)